VFKAVRSGIEHGEQNEPPRGPKEEHHHRLQTALVEAQQLAYFATRNGISIEPDDLEIVTTSAENCAELESDPNKEKAFWMAFQRLAAAVFPVTTESIQAAPQAKRAVATYAVYTIVILLLLVALQIYWLIGANLVAEIGGLRVQMAEHRTKIVAGHARENGLDELIEAESKEVARLEKEKRKLHRNLDGIRRMSRLPDAVFVIDTRREKIAVDEARKLRIPVIGLVDTNCDPEDVDYVIPGNDDALRAIRLFVTRIADAVISGRGLKEAAERADEAPQAASASATEPAPAPASV